MGELPFSTELVPPPPTQASEANVTPYGAEGRGVGELGLAEGVYRFLSVGEQGIEEQFLLGLRKSSWGCELAAVWTQTSDSKCLCS